MAGTSGVQRNYRDLVILRNARHDQDAYRRCAGGTAASAAAASVAPEVITSSTSSTCRPLSRAPRRGCGRIAPLSWRSAASRPRPSWRGGSAGAGSAGRACRSSPVSAGQSPGQQRGLVVAAPEQPGPVQRHRATSTVPGGRSGLRRRRASSARRAAPDRSGRRVSAPAPAGGRCRGRASRRGPGPRAGPAPCSRRSAPASPGIARPAAAGRSGRRPARR